MKKHLLTLVLALFIPALGFATHGMGGELTYKSLGNNKYKIIGKFFRDCRGIPLSSPSVGWFAGKSGDNSCGSGTLSSFTRTGIYDISNICTSKNPPCDPSQMGAEGVELHVYETTVDLSTSPFASVLAQSTCTELNFYIGQCCRTGAITTGPAGNDFFVTCQIHIGNLRKCKTTTNNSVEYHGRNIGFVCVNLPYFRTPGATDTAEKDSISFHIVPAISALPGTSVTYTTPFTYAYPVTPYCVGGGITCTPSITTNPPRGFYLDNTTGDIIYTPTKSDEVAVVNVEAREWRRDTSGTMVLVGKTHQDIQIVVKDDCGYNNAPVISGSWKNTVVAGDKICFNFKISDAIFKPNQKTADSILVSWTGESPNPKFTVIPDTIRNFAEVQFCWQTSEKDSNSTPYLFGIYANDDNCPRPANISRGFTVRVLPRDSSWLTFKDLKKCNSVQLKGFTLKSKISLPSFEWALMDSSTNRLILTGFGDSFTFSYLPIGSYCVIMKAKSLKYGYRDIKKYFSITTGLPSVSIVSKEKVCIGSKVTFTAVPAFLKTPVVADWRINITNDTSNHTLTYSIDSITTNKKIFVFLKDALGCSVTDTANCMVLSRPVVSWTSSPLNPLCRNAGNMVLENNILSPADSLLPFGKLSIRGSLTKYGTNGLVDSTAPYKHILNLSKIPLIDLSGGKYLEEQLIATFIDSNQCAASATTKIRINGNPVVEVSNKEYCQNRGGELNLDSLVVKPKITFGTTRLWNTISTPSGVNSGSVIVVRPFNGVNQYWFQFGSKGLNTFAGYYQLAFTVTDDVSGCKGSDTSQILLRPQPVLNKITHPGLCSKPGYLDLLDYFEADGNKMDSTSSYFRIKAFNNNTDSTKWKNVLLQYGHLFPTDAPFGTYTVHSDNNVTGCFNNIDNDFFVFANPIADFTTTPKDSAPITLPYFNTQNKSSILSSDALSYLWYFNYPDPSMKNSSIAPVISYPPKYGIYTVRLITSSSKGCESFFERKLQVGTKTNAVGSLLPSEYRMDQQFRISGPKFRSIETSVFDVSGKLLAHAVGNQGIILPTGVYIYRILLHQDNGNILVLRGKMVLDR